MNAEPERSERPEGARKRQRWPVPVLVGVLVAGLSGGLFQLLERQAAVTNSIALSSEPKAVRVVSARVTQYRPARRYVGTLRAWHRADMGPQLVAAYLKTVLVRAGDFVERDQILATLDCRNPSAGSERVSQQIEALSRQHKALASEVKRLEQLASKNYVSPNELEQKAAQSAAAEARLGALRAQLRAQRVEVEDCVLRAPFDGEVAARKLDPGAFVRPGMTVLTVVDRRRLRLEFDVPERDYPAVAPGTPVEVRLVVTDQVLNALVTRRSPAANASTRTVRVEVDLDDPNGELPVGTTGEVHVELGELQSAVEVPLRAAVVKGNTATLFVIEGGRVETKHVRVLGEAGARLFVEPVIDPGTPVVVEGRRGLTEGEPVLVEFEPAEDPPEPSSANTSPADHRVDGEREVRSPSSEQTSL